MPAHWLGSASPLVAPDALLGLLGLLEVLGVLGELLASDEPPLDDCAHAALASRAAATAAAICFNVIAGLLR
jgi:hypothetical protein